MFFKRLGMTAGMTIVFHLAQSNPACGVTVKPNDTVGFTATRTTIGTNVTVSSPTFNPPADPDGWAFKKLPDGKWAHVSPPGLDAAPPDVTGGAAAVSAAVIYADSAGASSYTMVINGELRPPTTPNGGGGGGGPVTWAGTEDAGKPKITGESNVPLAKTITLGAIGGQTPYTWSSNHPDIGKVDASGTVRGMASGSVIITLTDANGKTDTLGVTVQVPDGETTEFHHWVGQSANFQSVLTPTSVNFAGITVKEFDGDGSSDECWFKTSQNTKNKFEHVSGSSWTVGSANLWKYDGLAWSLSDITFYRQHNRTPCHTTLVQDMKVMVPGGTSYQYLEDQLVIEIGTTTITATRNGVTKSKTYFP